MSRNYSILASRNYPAAYDDDDDDIVWGVEGEHGIAAAVNLPPKKVRRLIQLGLLPVRRHGHRTYSASRRRLRQYCAGEFQNSER